jgi:hypothetical protein
VEIFIVFLVLFPLSFSAPTAGVTDKGGIWREKPPDAESASWSRLPESAAERPHLSGAPHQDGRPSFFPKETAQRGADRRSILLNRQVWRPYNALETHRVAVPWCTVVAGQIDVSTGGEGDAMTPMRKLKF